MFSSITKVISLPHRFLTVLYATIIKAYNKKELKQADKEHGEPFLLPHISAHILRHTFCTRAAESGVDVKSLQYIMGHADITMTMERYNHVDEVRVQNEMSKTEGIVKIG